MGDLSLLCLSINLGSELDKKEGAATILCVFQVPHCLRYGLILLNLNLLFVFFAADIIFGSNE